MGSSGRTYRGDALTLFGLGRLLLAVWRGLRSDETFRALFISVGLLLAAGTGFYTGVEGWSVVDAFYFSVMTLATVGFGDLAPVTVAGKLFTVGYVLFGVGVLAVFIGELAKRRRPGRLNESGAGT